jgi:DNA-binding HxlR family transcriptional regulator
VGERWGLLVVRDLMPGPKQFPDLLAGLPGISPNVLSKRLRELVEFEVVDYRDLPAPESVRVYELTAWGRQLEPVLRELEQWGRRAPHIS